MCMLSSGWKYSVVLSTQCQQDAGEQTLSILHVPILYALLSVNATYGVGIYYSNNGTLDSNNVLDNANVYWLNNFENLWRSYG